MIKRRAFVLFFLAVVLGLGAAWVANRWLDQRMTPEVAAVETEPVVVAALDIAFGQPIEAASVRTVHWPKGLAPAGTFSSTDAILGKVASQNIFAGEPLMRGRVLGEVEGSTLAAVIDPDKRAVSVRVNDVVGVGGFLLPGNRVDVLATRMEDRRALTRTLLEDLKVLAVDQKASPDRNEPVVVRAVTLEMGPKDAEKLVQATEEGTVQLALRNPKANPVHVAEAEKPEPIVQIKEKVVYKPRPRPSTGNVTVIRGTAVDVSKVRL